MTAVDMQTLVSQAEKEGVTLAEIISRELTSEQMQEAQDGLVAEMAENYSVLADFLSDVEVSSSEELFEMSEEELEELQEGLQLSLSDKTILSEAD